MKQTIQIADKPTLDEVTELLRNSSYGLETLKKIIEQGNNQANEINLPYIYSKKDTVSGGTTKTFLDMAQHMGIAYVQTYNNPITSLILDGTDITDNSSVFISNTSGDYYYYRIPFVKSIKIDISGQNYSGERRIIALLRYL